MKRTIISKAPVISLLSPSPTASRRAQEIFNKCFGLEIIDLVEDASSLPSSQKDFGSPKKWDSVVSGCSNSGVYVHCLSIADSNKSNPGSFSLLSISDTKNKPIEDAISSINSTMLSNVTPLSLSMKFLQTVGRGPPVERYFDQISLPAIMNLPDQADFDGCKNSKPTYSMGLKEIAFNTTSKDDTSRQHLSQSNFPRPKPGLYMWPSDGDGLCVRPLPPAEHDRRSVPLVLVFNCDNLGHAEEKACNVSGVATAKIGFGGVGNGQLMVKHNDLAGLDLRFCESRVISAMFNEAQESVLAGSIDEIQSANTMLSDTSVGKDDPNIGNGDCWKEFRATLKQPSGYFSKGLNSGASTVRVARIPPPTPDS